VVSDKHDILKWGGIGARGGDVIVGDEWELWWVATMTNASVAHSDGSGHV
jgi:hypothetical protein